MAGEWIKMRGNLWSDPRVGSLADSCGCGEATVVGALYWLWSTADQHTEDGVMPGLSRRQIDRKTGVPGFGDALAEIGWIADHPDGLLIVKFEEHNGASAKRRCMEAQRKANGRNVSASDADKTQTKPGQKSPGCGAREEEEEEKKSSDADASGGEAADVVTVCALLATEGRDLTDDEEKLLWNAALALLMPSYAEGTGPPKLREARARTFIGGLGKRIKDGGAARRVLFDVIQAACVERPANPETWLSAAVASRTGKRTANKQADLEETNLAAAAAFAGA